MRCFQLIAIAQHTCRDCGTAHGDAAGSGKDRGKRDVGVWCHHVDHRHADEHREHHLADAEDSSANAEQFQFFRSDLQTDREQQQGHAQFRHHIECFGVALNANEFQDTGADQHARHQVADHRTDLEALKNRCDRYRTHQKKQEFAEKSPVHPSSLSNSLGGGQCHSFLRSLNVHD